MWYQIRIHTFYKTVLMNNTMYHFTVKLSSSFINCLRQVASPYITGLVACFVQSWSQTTTSFLFSGYIALHDVCVLSTHVSNTHLSQRRAQSLQTTDRLCVERDRKDQISGKHLLCCHKGLNRLRLKFLWITDVLSIDRTCSWSLRWRRQKFTPAPTRKHTRIRSLLSSPSSMILER